MKIITVSFDFGARNSYDRLLEVLVYSIKRNMPQYNIEIIKTHPPESRDNRSTGLITNTAKLNLWVEAMERTKEDIILMDCDMLIIKDMSDAWNNDFDIAYTTREMIKNNKGIPINGGVMFVRNNERSRQFLRRMREINDMMYIDPSFHRVWRLKYKGMNQSAFGYMLENERNDCKLIPLPCKIYNLCNTEWHLFDDNVRCIHYKSALRRAALGQRDSRITSNMDRFVKIWRHYEADMLREKRDENKKTMGRDSGKVAAKKNSICRNRRLAGKNI